MTFQNLLLTLLLTSVGLTSGLLFSFAVAINPGLSHLDNKSYILVMQHINHDIHNILFLTIFISPLFLLPVSTYIYKDTNPGLFLAVATIFYIIVFSVTLLGNIPLNNKLDKLDTKNLTTQEIEIARNSYSKEWGNLHNLRTVASVLCFLALLIAIIY